MFRLHYDKLQPDQKRNMYALVSPLSKLWGPNGIEDFSRRCQELGDTEEASLDVSISVIDSRNEARATYELDPTELKNAIEYWDRGEGYSPPIRMDRPNS